PLAWLWRHPVLRQSIGVQFETVTRTVAQVELAVLDLWAAVKEPPGPRDVLNDEAVRNRGHDLSGDLGHEVAGHRQPERFGQVRNLQVRGNAAHARQVRHRDVYRPRLEQRAKGGEAEQRLAGC